jgi:hypothetical protein
MAVKHYRGTGTEESGPADKDPGVDGIAGEGTHVSETPYYLLKLLSYRGFLFSLQSYRGNRERYREL